MTLPQSAFADAFREHVLPALQESVEFHALLMALDDETFMEAHTAVMRQAIQRGASHLPDAHLDALDEWIGTALLDSAAARPERSERVHRDLMQWESTAALMLDMGARRGE